MYEYQTNPPRKILLLIILSIRNWSFRSLIFSRGRPSKLLNSGVQNYYEEGKRMNPKRWLGLILMAGLILALNSLSAQADPYPTYHHPRGNAYGWHGQRTRGFDRHFDRRHEHFRRACRGPHSPRFVDRGYAGPPPVAYIAPVAPVMAMPYAPPQPYYSQPPTPGLSGQLQYNF